MKKRVWIVLLCLTICAGCGQPAAVSGPESSQESENTLAGDNREDTVEQGNASAAENVWVPKEAPAVRESLTDEEKNSMQMAILEKGIFLFSGKTNEGYSTNDLYFLASALALRENSGSTLNMTSIIYYLKRSRPSGRFSNPDFSACFNSFIAC